MDRIFSRWFNQIKDFYLSLSSGKKFFLWFIFIFIIAFSVFITRIAVDTNFSILYSNLDLEDSSVITGKLKDKKIPYRYDPKTGTISVPPEFIHDTRLFLASDGLPGTSSVVGFEVFDKSNFGMNSYVQRINYIRAKEGELTRTLSKLSGVERARVHITVPEKKTFVDDEKPAKASVVLKLGHGKNLSKNQVMGIQHLVSSAVENLDKDNVVIMDQSGKMLSSSDVSNDYGITNQQLEYKKKVESTYEQQIISMLERVVGVGSVEARVNADIDFTKQTMTVEDYDPDRTVVRSKVTSERLNQGSRPSPSGIPGARSNLPDEDGNIQTPEVKQSSQDINETVNNEITRTIKNIVKGQGEIKRITIAVIVDGIYEDIIDDSGKVTGKKFISLEQETLDRYKAMVGSAVGIVDGRDNITIESMAFKDINLIDDANMLAMEKWNLVKTLIQYLVIATLIFLFFIFFVRPFIKWITDNISDKPQDMLPTTIEELESFDGIDKALEGLDTSIPMLDEAIDPEKAESELLKEKIMSLIEGDPYKATQAITEWLKVIDEKQKEKELEKVNV